MSAPEMVSRYRKSLEHIYDWNPQFLLSGSPEMDAVSEWRPFGGSADIWVHIAHTSRVIIAYTLESLSSLT